MKKWTFIVALLGMLFLGWIVAEAANVKLDWDSNITGTTYKIEMSVDLGATWLAAVTATTKPFVYPNVPEDKLVLFRVSAFNNAGQTVTRHAGAWYDHRKLLPATTGLSAH